MSRRRFPGRASRRESTGRLRHHHRGLGLAIYHRPPGLVSPPLGGERLRAPYLARERRAELERARRYPNFRISSSERHELLGGYLPWCEVVEVTSRGVSMCRDEKDQPFLDLAQGGKAEVLASGDRDLLATGWEGRLSHRKPRRLFPQSLR
jgi:predicted nucleic acid-binding protein